MSPARRSDADMDRLGAATRPARPPAHFTVSVPSLPAWRWPGTVQKNWYLPAFTSTLTFETPPSLTTGPASLTPAPSIAMLCAVEDLFGESTSSAPVGASPAENW